MTKYIPTIYALLGILLVTSSCSQEYPERGGVHESRGRIEFMASLPEISTRATELTIEALDSFKVSAFIVDKFSDRLYFTDKTFIRNKETQKYVCNDTACIWPNNNDLIKFIAFVPSCNDMRDSGGAATLTGNLISGFKVPQDIASQFDFMTANALGRLIDNEETGIALKFQHQLSRIQLKAWGNSDSYDLEIAGVRIGGVGTGGEFSFSAPEGATNANQEGEWESVSKGYVEYIFGAGDKTVMVNGSTANPGSAGDAVSILGAKIGGVNGYENSAMIVPSNNPGWEYKENPSNGETHEEGMYISVLLRVTDKTPYATPGSIVYPSEGNMQTKNPVYLAVDKEDEKTVKTRVYKDGEKYYTDVDPSTPYDIEANNATIKEFGWAALPVEDELKPGLIYTYTLNYTKGVGLRDPHDSHPGESIISDRVLVNVEVTDWQTGANKDVEVPR